MEIQNDFLSSSVGVEKLDAACMVIIALGEAVKTLDKLSDKKLPPTYPSIEWKEVMGARDITLLTITLKLMLRKFTALSKTILPL